jgi:2-polyprenyl-3-methyl-5-hydroxy-6-metoxy-1,4-benzoquinol methylase
VVGRNVSERQTGTVDELSKTRAEWDEQAATFDQEPDHGLVEPLVREAWRSLMVDVLPPAPARVVDLGCGTGSLAVLLAEAGYDVTGLDLSPAMLVRAEQKAAGAKVRVRYVLGDAADPTEVGGDVDVVLARHVVWALPDPETSLRRWARLVRPRGRLVLVEGRWHTGGGLTANALAEWVRPWAASLEVRQLTESALWGGPTTDERYVLIAGLPQP